MYLSDVTFYVFIFSETEDAWEVSIKDAILEKCKEVDGILHIYVDAASKEVLHYILTGDRSVPKICKSGEMLSHPKVSHPSG